MWGHGERGQRGAGESAALKDAFSAELHSTLLTKSQADTHARSNWLIQVSGNHRRQEEDLPGETAGPQTFNA